MNTESPTTAKPKRERTQAQKDAHAKKERERRQRNAVLKGTPQSAPGLAIEPAMIPAPHVIDGKWQSIDVDGETIKVKASLSPAEAEKVARNLVEARKPAKDVERPAAQDVEKAEKAKRKAARTPRAPRPAEDEARAPGAGSVVNGLAGRWVRLGNDRKWAHVPLHTEFEKKIGRDSYTSPAGSTEVFKNGESFNAPRIPKA